jgi:hypothetical protein
MESNMYQTTLSDCDIARIIAGLRLLQDPTNPDILDIVTNGGEFSTPSDTEIDQLCESLNFADAVKPGADISAPSPAAGEKIAYVCPECGSHEVCSDAAARWDAERQAWELAGVHDNSTCQECGHDADLGFEVQL